MTSSRATHSEAVCKASITAQAARDPLPHPLNYGDKVTTNTSPHQDTVQSSMFVGSTPQLWKGESSFKSQAVTGTKTRDVALITDIAIQSRRAR